MTVNWSGKVVLITGASSGIGRSLAVELGKRGASVGLLARRADSLREVAREVEAAGGRALALPADVTDAAAVRAAADELRGTFGAVDVLVANAGVGVLTDDYARLGEQVAETVEINLLGAANSAGAVLPEMIARGEGQLVAISSLASYRGLPKSGAYCASKAALWNLTLGLARALAPEVRVNAVAPGAVDSSWMIEWSNEQRSGSIDKALLKRRCTTDDLAEVMLFLLAGAAMVTGQTVTVDGGLTLG
jgi:3-oxoacyl-[acyl-carrier protein] reductase